MPGYNLILNLPGFTIVKVSGYHPLILDVVYQRKARCCHCTSKEVRKKTLTTWKDEVARMWRFTKSNGITEGFHRKMKLIQRRAYGFRNFENYRVRVKVLCG